MLLRLRRRAGAHLRRAVREPGWIPLFLVGRLVAVRHLHRRWLGLARPLRPTAGRGPARTAFPALVPGEAAATLVRDGIITGLRLPEDRVAAIRTFALQTPCFGDGKPDQPIHDVTAPEFCRPAQPYVIGDYLHQVGSSPEIRSLAADPALRNLAASYLSVNTPNLRRVRLWWSFVSTHQPEIRRNGFAQMFHFDLDDWRALKVFFYINETGLGAGPHQFIRGSHRNRPLRWQVSLFKGQAEAAVHAAYSPADILTLTGPAGFGFAEDPFGLHRGTLVTTQPRLMLEIEYGVTRPRHSPYGAPDVGVR
ncbi:hypothetical protein [Oleisolibacter albus]|uniref:hypothetical protein n=1 Tax=Oleisolibacter albus TaxID=2171757 RepID=UPI000DF150EB|nr:hypothetical protein [Oleisolibacter albus]